MINDYEEYILCYVKTFVYSLLIYHFILRSLFSFTYDYLYPSGCGTYCYSGDYATLTIADSLVKATFRVLSTPHSLYCVLFMGHSAVLSCYTLPQSGSGHYCKLAYA